MQQRNIIIFLLVIFIASSAWLFRASNQFTDPNIGKNWWAISFSDPTSKNINFTIENHSEKTDFHWAVLGAQKLKEGDEEIAKGETKNISVDDDFDSERITVEVILGDESKKIYKNL